MTRQLITISKPLCIHFLEFFLITVLILYHATVSSIPYTLSMMYIYNVHVCGMQSQALGIDRYMYSVYMCALSDKRLNFIKGAKVKYVSHLCC